MSNPDDARMTISRWPPWEVIEHALALLGVDNIGAIIDSTDRTFRILRCREALAGALGTLSTIGRSDSSISQTLGILRVSTCRDWLRRYDEWPGVLRQLWIGRLRTALRHDDPKEIATWYGPEAT